MKPILEAAQVPGALGLALLALWNLPAWGQRWLAFRRDWDDYRRGR